MKKFVLIALALLLALPAASFAGSATSRWDVTIGGFVAFDVGWADQSVGADYLLPQRNDFWYGLNENRDSKYGTTYWAAGFTRLSFAIKGPDTWGAKTSAYIEGEFTGATGAATSYGLFRLRHAFMNFDWGKYSILMGQTWDAWGIMFPDLLGRNEETLIRRGVRAPQIRFTQKVTPEWFYYLSVYQPNADSQGTWNSSVDNNNRSLYPHVSGELNFATDKCGKIGSDKLLFAVGGMFGREKIPYISPVWAGWWDDDTVDSWAASFKGFIPIIPEKKADKSGALFLKGQITYGQNWRAYTNVAVQPYDQDILTAGVDFVAPVAYAWYGQMGYYFTNTVWANLFYGQYVNNLSDRYMTGPGSAARASALNTYNHWAVNVIYDPSPAVRLGLQYSNITARYANYATAAGSAITNGALRPSGSLNAVRFQAQYFF